MGLFKGHNTVTRADKISNFTVNTAEYGAPVMEVLGTTRISGNVIYYDDFTSHEHKETQRAGKGGKSTHTNITYTYTVAVILGLCEGPVSGIGKVWKNKEVYDYPNDNIQLTLFAGTQNQQPWPYVVGRHPERALAYEGLAYMAGVIDLGDSAGMPSYNFEVKGKLLNTGDGIDVNPMDYIKYVLAKVGQGNATVYGEENFRSYCANANLLISTPSEATGTAEAQKIVNEIADLCGAYVFWSNDAYKIIPLADRPVGEWTPDKTIRYDLTEDDFIPQNGSCVTWARKDSSEQYNRWTVEFQNRANSYEKESVTYEDVDDIAERGVKQAPTINAGYVYTKERAVLIAEAAARRNKVGKNQYQFKLGWAFCRLEPGDLVRITDAASGINNVVVIIKDIQEGADGLLAVTAISWFQDNYSAAEYDVHEVDRPDVDFNVPPGSIASPPLIIQPPADLTQNGLEVWIGAKGATENWGGCTVYVSDDNVNYRTVGQITNTARIGELQANMTATATSCTVSCNDVLLSGTQQDAERGNTLVWIGGECMSYTTATMQQNGDYLLSGLVRGQYNTEAKAHTAGEQFARLDSTLLKEAFRKEDVGKKIYLKFCSYNIFGAMEQSLADVQPYQYTLQAYYVPPVRNVTARNRYRQIQDGVPRYDIAVAWETPTLESYLEGRVWYKTNHGQIPSLSMQGVAVNQVGFEEAWTFGGSGKDNVIIPQAVVGDTYRIAVTTVDIWGVETSPDASPQVDILVALKTEVPNTPDGLGIAFGESAVASWNEVTNTDVAFYELRLDQQAGVESANLLARVTGLTATLPLTNRTGTIYLFAYSASGHYSYPAVLEYSKAAPPTPTAPTLTAKLGGFSLVAGAIPSGCNGMNIYIDGVSLVSVHTVNNVYTYTCDAGIYDVQVAYTDIFGEGAKSNVSRVTVKATVDSSLLEQQAVTKANLETALQDAVDDAVQSAQDIVGIKSDILGINGDISDINDDITSIDRDIADINGSITDINTDLASVESTANGIITELGKAPAQSGYRSISDLKTDVDNVSITVASNKTTQDGINSTVGSRLTVAEGGISAITTNLNKAAGSTGYAAITQLNTSVSGLQSQVEEIYEMTDEGIAPDIAAMKSQIQQNSRSIETVVSNLNASASGNTYASISSLSQRADSIASTVSSNKTAQDAINAGTSSSGLKTLIETNASNITQTANGVSAIVTKLNSTTGILDYAGVSALSDEIAAVDLKADGISTTVTNNKTAQDAINAGTAASGLKSLIDTNTTNISQNASDISSVASRVTATENKLAGTATSALLTKINQNASGISSVATRVTTTEGQLAGTTTSALLTKINQNASGISAVVADVADVSDGVDAIEENLNDSTKARSYTAIQVMQDGIASKCTLGEATSYFQQSHVGFYIKGSLIQIDGDTIIGNNVITRNAIASNAINASKIAAGAVTAAKISVDSLSAITANVGTLEGGTITGTELVGATIRNSDDSFSVDANGNIVGATLTSGTINADMITSAGFQVKASTIISGTVSGNKGQIPLPAGYSAEQCLWAAYPNVPRTSTHGGQLINTYFAVNQNREVTCIGTYFAGGESDTTFEEYSDCQYRVIGIK